MENFISRLQKYIEYRKSEELKKRIKNLKHSLELIENIVSDYSDNFWIQWFYEYLKKHLLLFRMYQMYVPSLLLFSTSSISKNSIDKIYENNRLKIKNLFIPFVESDDRININMIEVTDCLLPYLFDYKNQDTLYSLYSYLPSCSLYSEGPYEYNKVILEKDDIVIDAGANIGCFSALASDKGCTTYAFEPIPNIINKYLSKTSEWNPNITICKYALAEKQTELTFYENVDNLGSSSSVIEYKDAEKITVQAIDLDTYVKKNNLQRIDFIKADIEGAERYMLMGAKQVLKEFAPKISICTYHLPDDPKVLREIILDANPNYVIEERWMKMYAHVPKYK